MPGGDAYAFNRLICVNSRTASLLHKDMLSNTNKNKKPRNKQANKKCVLILQKTQVSALRFGDSQPPVTPTLGVQLFLLASVGAQDSHTNT